MRMKHEEAKRPMRRWLRAMGLAGALLLLGGGWAWAGIAESKHNLSKGDTRNDSATSLEGETNEICIYCHTPHQAADISTSAPLWNRNMALMPAAGTYTMYSSPTFDASADLSSGPTGVSRACLSCHDGTVGINQLLNNKGSGMGTASPVNASDKRINGLTGNQGSIQAVPLLGTDLSNDHPVSMRYDQAKSPNGSYSDDTNSGEAVTYTNSNSGFNTITFITGKGINLYGGATAGNNTYVQCASCHDPHNAGNLTFLRIQNTNSKLCLTCHNKTGRPNDPGSY